MSVCLSACMFAWTSVRHWQSHSLSVSCMSVCYAVCLSVCLSTFLSLCQSFVQRMKCISSSFRKLKEFLLTIFGQKDMRTKANKAHSLTNGCLPRNSRICLKACLLIIKIILPRSACFVVILFSFYSILVASDISD